MQAVILAAGSGSRLLPLTEHTPKLLIKVKGVPFADMLLTLLKKGGFTDVVITTYHLAELIEEYIGNGKKYGLNIAYSKRDDLLNTAGSLFSAKDLIKDEPFFVFNCDIYFDIDFRLALDKYLESESEILYLASSKHSGNVRRDIVVDKKSNKVTNQILGSSPNNLIEVGKIMRKKHLKLLKNIENESIEDCLLPLILSGDVSFYLENKEMYDVGTFENIKLFEESL